MNSSRPYLVRAFYEWIVDNQLTPYVLVNAEVPDVEVPKQYIENGKIILNISPSAINELQISNQTVEFDASFSGQPMEIYIPIKAILAIYARENGRGMVFNQEEEEEDGEIGVPPPPLSNRRGAASKSRKPKLTVVK